MNCSNRRRFLTGSASAVFASTVLARSDHSLHGGPVMGGSVQSARHEAFALD